MREVSQLQHSGVRLQLSLKLGAALLVSLTELALEVALFYENVPTTKVDMNGLLVWDPEKPDASEMSVPVDDTGAWLSQREYAVCHPLAPFLAGHAHVSRVADVEFASSARKLASRTPQAA